jgi:Tfp pilus assembly protein PilN
VRPLNLATQPFRNETLPLVLLAVGGLVLVLVTAQHALTIRRLLPDRTSAAHRKAAALEEEAARLRAEVRETRVAQPPSTVIAQWRLLKELVDRRAFSWTGLFSVLEEVLPPGVRLMSIAPRVDKDEVTLELTAAARSYERGLELIRILEDRPEFSNVYPVSRGDEEESRFRYTMRYVPQEPSAAIPAPPDETAGPDEAVESGERPASTVSLVREPHP